MSEKYQEKTISNIRGVLFDILKHAVWNQIVPFNPVSVGVSCKSELKKQQKEILLKDEQISFLNAAKGREHFNLFSLILQTGLRFGETCGVKWQDIDWENKTLHVQRTLFYSCKKSEYEEHEPKTKSGNCLVPLTDEAVKILCDQKKR